jgi:hypothetical protein
MGRKLQLRVIFLSSSEHVFIVPTRGCVIVPLALTETVAIGETIQLRSGGACLDSRITGIEMITRQPGLPCKLCFLLSEEITKSQIPPGAEIWIRESK